MIEPFSLEYLNILITFGLVILIWIIQILHYPSFFYYEEKEFSRAMLFHQRAVTFITLPLMVSELVVSGLIVFKTTSLFSIMGVILVALIWISTFFIQVPLHEKLTHSKNTEFITKLIKTNWIRTYLWSLKFILLAWQSYL